MTMLSGFVAASCCCSDLSFAVEGSFSPALRLLAGMVGGAVSMARASRCLVMLSRPTRMCDPIAGAGGGGASSGAGLLPRFRFLPLEGCMCVLRCSPSGVRRLQLVRTNVVLMTIPSRLVD